MSRDTDELLDHDYDGVREYDNPLPRWWLWLFYVTIAWSLVYVPYYHFMGGPLQEDEYQAEMAAAAADSAQMRRSAPAEDLPAMVKDPARVAAGKESYEKLCVACHLADGGGLVGPNLTDDAWKHGGRVEDLLKVINEGVAGTAMVSWKNQLSRDQMISVIAYIRSLRGTKPANPKPAEGTPYTGEE